MKPLIEMRGIVKTYNVGKENELEILHGIDLTAVSYTHLDVYKRQVLVMLQILA